MSNTYDLIIVGGGLVGASLLLALRDSGLNIALIEAKEHSERVQPVLDQRSLVLSLGSKLFYESLGIWPDITKYATEINKIKISEQGCFNKVFLNKSSFGVDALGYVVNIQLLNKALWDNIKSAKNIDVLCPYKLLDLTFTESCAELNLQELNNSNSNSNSTINITGKIIIAADGGRSYIRDLIKIPYDKHDYKQLALIANVEHELENDNIAYERFSKHGPFAILPRENKKISGIVWPWDVNKQDYIKSLPDNELLDQLQNLFGYKLGKFTNIGNRQFFPLWRVCSRELSKDRVLLLGNAANHIHPVGGQGFNLGLRDVKSFSKFVLKYKNILISNNYNIEAINNLFAEYADSRIDDHYNLKNNTHNLLDLFSSNKSMVKLTRRVGMTVMNHSLLIRTMIADHSMGLR